MQWTIHEACHRCAFQHVMSIFWAVGYFVFGCVLYTLGCCWARFCSLEGAVHSLFDLFVRCVRMCVLVLINIMLERMAMGPSIIHNYVGRVFCKLHGHISDILTIDPPHNYKYCRPKYVCTSISRAFFLDM